jgi:hypothetical protein
MSRPSLFTRGVQAADGTLPAVEVRGAAESCQANVECKIQALYNHARDLVVEGSSGDRYRVLRRNAAVHYDGSVPYNLHLPKPSQNIVDALVEILCPPSLRNESCE